MERRNNSKKKNKLNDLLIWYSENGIIDLDDLLANGKEASVNKIIKQFHKYDIFQGSDGRWKTYIKDDSYKGGRRLIVKKDRDDLIFALLDHYNSKPSYTMQSLWVEFETYRSSLQKTNTIKEDIKAYQKFYMNDPISTQDLNTIKSVDLEEWLANNIRKYKLTIHSYSKMKAPFSQLFKWAKRKGYVQNNPFEDIDTKKLPLFNENKKRGRQKAFICGEHTQIIQAAMDDYLSKPSPVPIAIILDFLTGLRVGELVALKWEDIDWERKRLYVCRYEEDIVDIESDFMDISHYHYVIYDNDTKGSYGPREVFLTDDAINLLKLLKGYYRERGIATEWLFYSTKIKDKIHDRAIDLRLEKYCKQIGIPRKSVHKIRSTYVSLLRDAGLTFESIAEQVGHKSTATTANNYSFDLKSEQDNQKMMSTALSADNVFESIQEYSKNPVL
ncbi:MAG: site-specific integrase [Lachnospiraceae bacterium]|nr:site-specific integrase [Lachnospiraceae bacterium]